MGFKIKKIAKAISNPVKALGPQTLVAPFFNPLDTATNVGGLLMGEAKDAPVANISEDLKSSVAKQNQLARNYVGNIRKQQDDEFNIAADPMRRALAQRLTDVREGANQRGLLYSGLARGAEAAEVQGLGKQLAGERARVNEQTEQQGRDMQLGAIDAGLALKEQNQNRENQIYQNQLNKRQQKQAGQSAVLGAAGSIAGGLLGGA